MLDEYIKKVREEVYGKEVREAIASALEKAYEDSNTSVEMEVINARAGYESLGDRLAAFTTEESQKVDEMETRLTELEKSIDSYEKSKFQLRTLTTEDWLVGGTNAGDAVPTGQIASFPIFDLVEEPESLLSVTYNFILKNNGDELRVSVPAFIRGGEEWGYFTESLYCTDIDAATVDVSHIITGGIIQAEEDIDTAKKMEILNQSDTTLEIFSAKAYIVTRW